VQALLQAYENPASILDRPPVAALPVTVDDAPPELPGTIVGSYKLIEQIGEGGMGAVWMAQQTAPVKRLVAVKLIKAGMDSRQVIARFEAERQALALMDHANIARVLDGGTTGAGRPYFVMDLVKGVPITRYCDEHHLTPRQRLELFVPVCQAVQHAHQKGIIHRDLKPSNVLVALYDGKPVPKVIDFGVAKAAGQSLTDKTLVTGFGNIVGTLEYMSPEQAEINQLDIDTRSDIYSLGVLLYELLAGSPPFSRKELEKAGMLEMLRVIREQEPSKPSTKLSTAEGLPTLAANRGTEPAKLTRLVRGELDWIVMKALEKDRNRRYETANGFAMDVQRYLADEPVLACPPSVGYRLRKFVRRNKAALVTAALILIAITVVAGTIGWIINDRQTQQRMTEREVENAVVEAIRLERQSNWAEALSWVTRAEGVLAHGGGNEDLRRRVQSLRADLEMVTALEEMRLEREDWKEKDSAYEKAFREYGIDVLALDPAEAAKRIQTRGVQDHLTDALYDWLNCAWQKPKKDHLWTVLGLADPDEWRNAFRSAVWRGDVETQRQLAAQPEFSRLRPYTAAFLGRQFHNRGETSKALELFLAIQQRYPADFWINSTLAWCYRSMNPPRLDQAIRYYTAAVVLRPRSRGLRVSLGESLSASGSHDEAIAVYRKAIELDPKYAVAYSWLGYALGRQGKLDEAIACWRKASELQPNYPPPQFNLFRFANELSSQGNLDEAITCWGKGIELDPKDLFAWNSRGAAYIDLKQYDKALKDLTKAIELEPKFAVAWNNRGFAYKELQQYDKALKDLTEAVELSPRYPKAWANRGGAYNSLHQYDKAIADLAKSIELNPKDAVTWNERGRAYINLQQYDKAIADFTKAIEVAPKYVSAWNNRGGAYNLLQQYDKALKDLTKAIELDPKFAMAWNNRGGAYNALKQYDKAIGDYTRAVELEPKNAQAHNNLGLALWQKGRVDEAIVCFRKAIDHDPKFAVAHNNLGNALYARGKREEAIACWREAIALDPKLALAHDNFGVALQAQGKLDEAIACHRKAIELDPKFANAHDHLGAALGHQGKQDEAIACYRKAIALDPKLAGPRNNLAWQLATSPDVKARDPARAVELAKEAVGLTPQNGSYWNTLGVAQYRAGDWKAAVEALDKSRQLRNGGDAMDWFFLAMAHWQLGAKEEARTWYDRARPWVKKNAPPNDELRRFRAEAEELLEIKKQ
jgi:tetratricopeptide (TPR) repeat protein/serine/threonine protein kinase